MLTGALRLRVRDICRQVCHENEVDILRGVLSSDHVHMFVSVPPKLAISDLVRKMKGRSSCKVQREFPAIRKRYWGCRFWGRGYFSTTNGAITEDVVLQYLKRPAKNLDHGFLAGRAKHTNVALRSPFSLSQVKGRTLWKTTSLILPAPAGSRSLERIGDEAGQDADTCVCGRSVESLSNPVSRRSSCGDFILG